ncbi:uncharacterized protein LOC114961056 isoform X2 [Acropora millepora]|uniref:uncharacterized protein LOC114961056 isoform X2 n=1 Tax=Acropora millepora TaxID=45264 RepID=UPI001CF1ECB9|nr:uncharacterized protein LOC114961056 isoform X2 [Acropora millepora]
MNKNKRQASVQRTVTMGNALRQDEKERQVEIIDDEDDEIEEISKQRTSAVSDRASRIITRRQRRDAANDIQFSSEDPGEEDWDQLQEVILLSKLEAEKQEERRKMCGTLQDVMSLQVEIEPLTPVVLKNLSTETSQSNKNKEEDQRDSTASPDIFSSSHEDQEQLPSAMDGGNIDSDKELPNSPPLPVTTRSPETEERDFNRSVTQSTDQRQENARKKPKLRRTRKQIRDVREQNEDVVDDEPKEAAVKIDEEMQSRTFMDEDDVVVGEKRKLKELDDGNDDTDDEDIPMKRKRMSLKRKKVSALNFEGGMHTEDEKIQAAKRVHDCTDDPRPKRVSVVEEEATPNNRSTPKGDEALTDTKQPRMSPGLLHARLSRKYTKARSRPRTVKEAMKANLYFAPRGFNISAYTTLIIRMFEKYKQRLNAAQCKAGSRLPWGLPVVCGKSQGKTLDAVLPGAKSSVFAWGTSRIDRETQLDPDVSSRRRTLRSSTTNLPNQTAVASTSTSATSHRLPPSCKVDSESDDEGLMTSYLDKVMTSSAAAGPSKKTQQSVKNNDTSEKSFVETSEQMTEASEETSEPKQTLTSSRVDVKNNDRVPGCRISPGPFTQSDQALFGVGVVLDSDASKSLWNEWDASGEKLQSEIQGMKESKTDRNESEDENSTNGGEACGGAGDEILSSLSDVIRPPKRRTSLRALDDDSTDDESNLSEPVISLSLPQQESPTSSQDSLENKTNSESKPRDKNNDILDKKVPVDSQSVLTQSESQGILGKSVLETMATDGDILYSSQVLTDTQASSQKLGTETSGRGGTVGLASSVLRPTAWTGRDVCPADEEFTIDLDRDESQNDRLKRSEAAEKAAAAAIQRQQGRRGNEDSCEASTSSSTINNSQQPENVQCPLCYNDFSVSEIEAHASDCQGLSSSTQASSSRFSTTGRPMTSSPSRPKPKLKTLKVVLERSPLVKDKLLERATQQIDLAKRNLDFNSSGKPDRNVRLLASSSRSLNQGSRTRGGKEGAAIRSDSGSETTGTQPQNDAEGSSGHSWLDPTR